MTIEPAELRTKRLPLRPYRLDDVDDVLAYAADEEWSRYLETVVPHPYGRRDAEEFIAGSVLAAWDENPTFAIVLEGTVIGGFSLRAHARNPVAEVGYSVSREHWGRGFVTEAARAVFEYGFRVFALERIFATADVRNRGSWRVMEKLGMQREGLLRSHRVDRYGEPVDVVYYGILREEWERARR